MPINTYFVMLTALALSLTSYAGWRLMRLRGAAQRPRPVFAMFWVWPFVWILFSAFFPAWRVPIFAFEALLGLIVVVAVVDFIGDYGLSAGVSQGQWRSCLLLVPLLAWHFRDAIVPPTAATPLYLPFHGKALVWTDHPFQPEVFYFIRTDRPEKTSAQDQDPNEGRPVFAPGDGIVQSISGQTLVLKIGNGTVALSPILPDSLRAVPGDRIFANQPLGILDASGQPPGLRLEFNGTYVFADVMRGRLFSQVFSETPLSRNQYVASAANSRWRIE